MGSNPIPSASGKLPLPILGGVQRYAEPHISRAKFKFIHFCSGKKSTSFGLSIFLSKTEGLGMESTRKASCMSLLRRSVWHHAKHG